MPIWPTVLVDAGVRNPLDLARTPLGMLARMEGVDRLSNSDWLVILVAAKALSWLHALGGHADQVGLVTLPSDTEPVALNRLGLPERLRRSLHCCQISDVQALGRAPVSVIAIAPHVGAAELREIVHRLRRYYLSLSNRPAEPARMPERAGASVPRELDETKRTLVRQRPSRFDEPTLADALSHGDPVAIRAFADYTVRRLLGGGLLSHVTDANLAKTFQRLKLTRPTRDHVQPVAYERMTGRSVSRLGLPAKASNALVRSGIRTVEQVLDSKVVDLAGVNRLGAKRFCQLIRTLARRLEEDPDFLAPGQTDTSPSVSSTKPDQIDLLDHRLRWRPS